MGGYALLYSREWKIMADFPVERLGSQPCGADWVLSPNTFTSATYLVVGAVQKMGKIVF